VTVPLTVVADNTFATPVNQNPLSPGTDLVLHSAPKFLGGHADAMGGAVCGDAKLVEPIYHFREITGAMLNPMAAHLLIRGMRTLPLRIRRQKESALCIARWLQGQPAAEAAFYPGLESDANHDIAGRQMRGFGGVLSFMLRGGFEAVKQVLPRLRFAHRAANLGAVETIAGPPATTNHVECSPQEREAMGIPEGLIRYSVGIEDGRQQANWIACKKKIGLNWCRNREPACKNARCRGSGEPAHRQNTAYLHGERRNAAESVAPAGLPEASGDGSGHGGCAQR